MLSTAGQIDPRQLALTVAQPEHAGVGVGRMEHRVVDRIGEVGMGGDPVLDGAVGDAGEAASNSTCPTPTTTQSTSEPPGQLNAADI